MNVGAADRGIAGIFETPQPQKLPRPCPLGGVVPTLLAPACSCEQQMREIRTTGTFECHHCDRDCARPRGTCVNCGAFAWNSAKKGLAGWVPPA